MSKLKEMREQIENRAVVAAVVFFFIGAIAAYFLCRQKVDKEIVEAFLTAMFGLPAVAIGAFIAFRLEADRVRRVERSEAFRRATLASATLLLMGNRIGNVLLQWIAPAQEAARNGVPLYLALPPLLPIDAGTLDITPADLGFLIDAEKDDLFASIILVVAQYKGYKVEIDARTSTWLEQLKPAITPHLVDDGIPDNIEDHLPRPLMAAMRQNTQAVITGAYGTFEAIKIASAQLTEAIHQAFPEWNKRIVTWPEIPPMQEQGAAEGR